MHGSHTCSAAPQHAFASKPANGSRIPLPHQLFSRISESFLGQRYRINSRQGLVRHVQARHDQRARRRPQDSSGAALPLSCPALAFIAQSRRRTATLCTPPHSTKNLRKDFPSTSKWARLYRAPPSSTRHGLQSSIAAAPSLKSCCTTWTSSTLSRRDSQSFR